MSDERKDLPPITAPNFLEKLRETVQTYLGNRGDLMMRGLVVGDLVDIGLVTLRPGILGGTGGGRRSPIAGPGPSAGEYEVDLTPPPAPDGLAAITSGTSLQVTIAAQTYRQGHGPAKVIVFGAKYQSGDPLPTYADAAVLDEFFGDIHAFPVDPAALYRIWAKSESVDGVESAVAGGTNGVEPTTGLLDDVSIASLSASRIRSGTITVGQYIQSAGYIPNVTGWRIDGDGTIRAINCVLAGTIYASAGAIGGNTIDATGLQSPGYTPGTTGWRLDTGGLFRAFAAGGARVIDMAATGTSPVLKFGDAFEVRADGTASYAGALSAATGSFAGALDGATGTFSGSLTAGVLDLESLVGTTATYNSPTTVVLEVPPEFTTLRVTLVGGGGGGGAGATHNSSDRPGGGGGAGGLLIASFSGLTPGTLYTLHVGAAGAGAPLPPSPWNNGYGADGTNGSPGGNTYIEGLATAYGGAGGGGGVLSGGGGAGGAGGTPTSGDNYNGADGVGGGYGGAGGDGLYGTGGAPAASYYNTAGNASGYGAGGAGGPSHVIGIDTSTAGGNGSAGRAVIEFFNPNGVVIRNEYLNLLSALQAQGIATS